MSHRLQVLIPESMDARIEKAAQRVRVSKGEWVRQAIEKSLNTGPGRNPVEELAKISAPTGNIDQLLSEIEAGRW